MLYFNYYNLVAAPHAHSVYSFRFCSRYRIGSEKPEVPEVQVAVRGRPSAAGRMADGGRAEADAAADVRSGRQITPGPGTGVGARHRSAGRPGRVQAGAQAAGLAAR